ncbi:hypothetical protein CPC08DRAFT_729723 [Agrocybe pediades]|nr:hypothetical protein CPC08DRAFT_729723 [Agrocybe pediades]
MPSRLLHTVNNTQVCKLWNGIISHSALDLWSNLFVITTPEGRLTPHSWIKRMIVKTQNSKVIRAHRSFNGVAAGDTRRVEITDTLVLFNFEPLPPVINLPKLAFMSLNAKKELCKEFVDRIHPSTKGCEIHSSTIPNWEYDFQQLDIQLELEPIIATLQLMFLPAVVHQPVPRLGLGSGTRRGTNPVRTWDDVFARNDYPSFANVRGGPSENDVFCA